MLPSSTKIFYQEFLGFYALRQHRNTQIDFPIKTTNVDPDYIINEVNDTNPEEKLRSSQNLPLILNMEGRDTKY